MVAGRAAAGLATPVVGPVLAARGEPTGLIPVATCTESGSRAPRKPSSYKADIAWGDDTRFVGLVRVTPMRTATGRRAATIEVLGAHTYATGVTVTLARLGARTSTTTVALVSGAQDHGQFATSALPTGPATVRRGRAAGPLTVARFWEVAFGAIQPAPDFAAEIAWGDGTLSGKTAQVVSGATVYGINSIVFFDAETTATTSNYLLRISARHRYREAGTKSVVVRLDGLGLDIPATTVIHVI